MTWQNIDITQLPFPEINNRCALYDRNIPTDSTLPQHLDLCRQGPCGHENQNAENIVKQAQVIEKWQTHPKVQPVYQKLLMMPLSSITGYVIEEELEKVNMKAKRFDENGRLIPNNPVDSLLLYLKDNRIRVTLSPLQIINGRHRLCAAKKFGVKNLLVDDISAT